MAGKKIFTLLAVIFLVTGCSGFFDFNLFQGMQPVVAPTASDYQGSEGLDRLSEDIESDTIVSTFTDQTVEEIETYLEGYWNDGDGVANEDDQQAAALYAELELVTTGGDEFAANVVNAASEIMNAIEEATSEGGEVEPEELLDILGGIVPENIQEDPDAFNEMIAGFVAANNAYNALGEALGDPEVELSDELNAGEIAQNAIVSFTVAALVDSLEATGLSQEEASTQIYYMLYDPDNVELTVTEEDFGALSNSFQETSENYNNLSNLCEEAGMDLESLGFGGGG
jgi:hypothetical protein